MKSSLPVDSLIERGVDSIGCINREFIDRKFINRDFINRKHITMQFINREFSIK